MIDLDFDKAHLWHPYTSLLHPLPTFPVSGTHGCCIELADGRTLIDGMASWWCAIHGYNHPHIVEAVQRQAERMCHVMFGGLTHAPAVELGRQLISLTPEPLTRLFFADSGSVSVEVALKMALQYWVAQGRPQKHRLLTIRGGYHGDTFGAMAICDPVTGMHNLFSGLLPKHLFAPRPTCRFDENWTEEHIAPFAELIAAHNEHLAAVALEPIVQGAGGMWFYHPTYLKRVRELCDRYDVLLLTDEIATGFGRTGKLFACHHAEISPDIMCVGKALTGGTMTLAAALCTDRVAAGIGGDGKGVLMHGPTFMANPLACTAARASLDLLQNEAWAEDVRRIETQLSAELKPLAKADSVADVRVLGAIGVVEMQNPVDVETAQQRFVAQGVWIRPFGRLVYLMPPYCIEADALTRLTGAIADLVAHCAF
jgi:adenosylmethionine-8-amino-7-oxononanoate aminotransferase